MEKMSMFSVTHAASEERWSRGVRAELPLLIGQRGGGGGLLHPPAPLPPPSFSPFYILFFKAASRFRSHALRIPQESPLNGIRSSTSDAASISSCPSFSFCSLSLSVRVSHPWPLPPLAPLHSLHLPPSVRRVPPSTAEAPPTI